MFSIRVNLLIPCTISERQLPYLTEQPPRHINITEGLDLNITCTSRVVPRPFITWYRNEVRITKPDVVLYRGKSTLMLDSIDSSSQGEYKCKANNAIGEFVSNASFITGKVTKSFRLILFAARLRGLDHNHFT
jgi:hypothetical protein